MDVADFSSLASDYSFRDCLLVCSSSGRQNLNQKVHKVVLGRWSDKFEREFSRGSKASTVTIRCDPKVFDTFVLYLYTTPAARRGLVNINNADELFLLGAEWDINLLKHHCEEFWLTEFTTFPKEKILHLLNFSVVNEVHGLQRRCFEFLARNMDDIPITSLKLLNRELMMRIILEVNIKSADLSLCFGKLIEWAYTCNIKCSMIVDMMTKAGWPEADLNTTQLQSMKLFIQKYQKLLQAPIFPLYKYVLELSLISHRHREASMAEQVSAQHQMNYKLSTLRKHWAEGQHQIQEALNRVKHQINPVIMTEIERQLFAVGDSVAKASLYEQPASIGSPATIPRFTVNDGIPMKEKLREIDQLSMEESRRMTFNPTREPALGPMQATRERHSSSLEPPRAHSAVSGDSSASASMSGPPRVSWSNGPKTRISWSDANQNALPISTLGTNYQGYFADSPRSRTRSRPETDSPKNHRAFRANTETLGNTLFNSKSNKNLDSSKNLEAYTPDPYEKWEGVMERNQDIEEDSLVE